MSIRLDRLRLLGAATLVLGLLLGTVSAAPGSAARDRQAGAVPAADRVLVGSLQLRHCPGIWPRALCGNLKRPWDPTGAAPGTVKVGFTFLPARDRSRPAVGTFVPNEGGPGYSTTGSVSYWVPMYGQLLRRRNLLMVDQRGTGRSEPINCPDLQNLKGPYAPATARCARQLGDRANLYGTALAADDLGAVIEALDLGRVDLYGDSYGTFFAQVFAGRHGDQLRSVVLDSAYPPTGETAWYPTQGPAMLRSIDIACERTPSCAAAGLPTSRLLSKVLRQVRRHPYRGRAADADGRMHRVRVDAKALVTVAFGATYVPASYIELPGALRAALNGRRKPLLRLTAESLYGGCCSYPRDYSEGLYVAVSCHDYPQLYDMTAPPSVRRQQFADAIRDQERQHPSIYTPFTIREYLDSAWQSQDLCLRWPVAPAAHPAGPPGPPSGSYPRVPVLVFSGELDSITTPDEGAMAAAQFPTSRHVVVANSFHVTAQGDTDGCAVGILRTFVAHPLRRLRPQTLACAHEVPPVRAVADYPRSFTSVRAALPTTGSSANGAALRAAATAVRVGGDMLNRWYNNYTGVGHGLYGGRWSSSGDRLVRFRLSKVRLTADLAVSGTMTWSRYSHRARVDFTLLRVRPSGSAIRPAAVNGSLRATWDTRASGARATIDGRLGGAPLHATMLAP